MKKILWVVIMAFIFGQAPAWAICPVEKKIDGWADSPSYFVKMGGMPLRGIHSVLVSPIELIYHPYDELRNRPQYGLGFIKGVGIGIFWAADKVLRGVWDVATAQIPDYNGEPSDHDDFEK